MPVRQWVLSFPIGLRILFAARPELRTPALRIVHRVIAGFLLRQAGFANYPKLPYDNPPIPGAYIPACDTNFGFR